jgi:hypothetical protein
MQSMREPDIHVWVSIGLVALSVLACRPIIAIGWDEFFILMIVFAIMLGPPLYRFIRKIEDFRRHERKDK